MKPQRKSRGTYTAREAAEVVGTSVRTAQRWTAIPRDEWLKKMATEREAIRVFHDDEGHSWPETAKHFGLAEVCFQAKDCMTKLCQIASFLLADRSPLKCRSTKPTILIYATAFQCRCTAQELPQPL